MFIAVRAIISAPQRTDTHHSSKRVFLFFGDTDGTNQWAKADLFPHRDASSHARPVNQHKPCQAAGKAGKGRNKWLFTLKQWYFMIIIHCILCNKSCIYIPLPKFIRCPTISCSYRGIIHTISVLFVKLLFSE